MVEEFQFGRLIRSNWPFNEDGDETAAWMRAANEAKFASNVQAMMPECAGSN